MRSVTDSMFQLAFLDRPEGDEAGDDGFDLFAKEVSLPCATATP